MEQSAQAPAWLPHGALLPADDWRWRHRAACLVLAAHLPLLLLCAALTEPGEVWHVLLPLARCCRRSRRGRQPALRSLAGTSGC
jgi:hypothetical protein